MNKPLVSVVVVNYNGKQYLKECFDSLFCLNYPKKRLDFIMIDNCSTDDSVKLVKNKYPTVKIVQNDLNNYARANNLGIKKAKGDYIAFVNNDVMLQGDWLIELVNLMQKENKVGVAGGKILFKDGRIQSSGHEEYPDFYWGDRGFKEIDHGQYKNIEEVSSLCGAAILFRKACLEKVNGFDEDFMMYLEDVDICLRAKRKNWKIMYVPASIALHCFRGTSSQESIRFFSEKNRLLMLAKHFPEKLAAALYGKGYFSETSQKNSNLKSIYDILPLVFSKLIETHNLEDIKNILPDLFKNLGYIANLDKSILQQRLEELMAAKESSFAQLKEAKNEISAKESSLAKSQQDNLELNSQLKEAKIEINAISYELEILKKDWERITNLDKEIKYLIIKPFRVSVKDTEAVISALKRKYPHSLIYLFANLMKEDYERLLKNVSIDKKLFYSPDKNNLSIFAIVKLIFIFIRTRFDVAITLVSSNKSQDYNGYRKAKLIALLSKAKVRRTYQID